MTETLVGGPCDGLEVKATAEPRTYAGRIGDTRLHVYLRWSDGRLHYDHTEKASAHITPPITPPVSK